MIGSGRLRFIATVQRESTKDNLGKHNKTFGTTVGTFRCDMRDTGSSESSYGNGVADIKSYEIQCRWNSIRQHTLVTTDRLLINGRTFNILGITNERDRNVLATITVEEIL